jgi:RluA family pseudouridine synthase
MENARDLVVLYEDDQLIAVDKPVGITVIPSRDREKPDLVGRVNRYLREKGPEGLLSVRARPLHRLDRDTTGALIMAKGEAAERFLSRQFEERNVEKVYLALVSGAPAKDCGEIRARIAEDRRRRRRMTISERGKEAHTRFELEESLGRYSLLRVMPSTGRRHQIRLHLAHVGFPLAVDPLYGDGDGIFISRIKGNYRAKAGRAERPLLERLSLHSHSLRFRHPRTGKILHIVAPLPEDMTRTLRQLRKYGL